MFGTSSGGYVLQTYLTILTCLIVYSLLAIMFGRLQMNVHDAKIAFSKYSADVFDHPRFFSFRGPLPWPRDTYATKRVDAAIKECVKEREPDHTRPWKQDTFASPDDPCKTYVLISFSKKIFIDLIRGVLTIRSSEVADRPFMFRTYDYENANRPEDCERAHSVPIWKVARATMAAPTYFSSVTIDIFPGSRFLDGGLGTNNPSFFGLVEVGDMYRTNKRETAERENMRIQKPVVEVLVSIGTGARKGVSRFGKKGPLTELFNLVRYMQAMATDVEETHQHMLRLCRQSQPETQYFRFNVIDGLDRIGLTGDRRRGKTQQSLERIDEATRNYLQTAIVRGQLRECARAVMNARRFRAPQPISPLLDPKGA
jgi:hypothetical protein